MPDSTAVRVLVCPDSFTGTLTAAQAADAIAHGWAQEVEQAQIECRPLSDGGPGFVAAVAAGRPGDTVRVEVTGPLGDPVQASYLLDEERTAWIESAAAAGLHLVPEHRRDPTVTTSRGVGELIAHAVASGARRVVVGVGGTGTSDGGAGVLAALGAVGDPAGLLDAGGTALTGLASVDLRPALAAVQGVTLEVATDVDVPLLGARGAARGFAPQKGADEEQVDALEAALTHWAHMLGRDAAGRAPAVALGAGAGGGIATALLRLGARRISGIDTVLQAGGILDLMPGVDLVVTGEGTFDWQSLRGKAVAGVAAAALERAVPTIVLAGRVELTRREWMRIGVAAAYPAAPDEREGPAAGLARAAARAAQTWARA